MPWKKTIRAGILLYALLMLALFSLLLQFYLNRQVALAQTNQANSHSLTAYAMAQYTKNKLVGELGKKEADEEDREESRETIAGNPAENQDLVKGASLEKNQADDAEQNRDSESLDSANQEENEQEAKKSVDQADTAEGSSKDVPSSGQINFDKGITNYYFDKEQLEIKVRLNDSQEFRYRFPTNSENH